MSEEGPWVFCGHVKSISEYKPFRKISSECLGICLGEFSEDDSPRPDFRRCVR